MSLRLPARSAVWENRATVPAMLLVSMVSIQLGTALATTLFAAAGVLGVVLMRNAFSALALTVVSRPALRGRPLSHWLWAAALGVVTMAMNLAFYASTARIPLGVAVAVDFLGPITVAVIGIRRPIQLVWPVLAYTGIALLTPLADITSLDPVGLLLALTAACGWGAYILMTARTGALFGGLHCATVDIERDSVLEDYFPHRTGRF